MFFKKHSTFCQNLLTEKLMYTFSLMLVTVLLRQSLKKHYSGKHTLYWILSRTLLLQFSPLKYLHEEISVLHSDRTVRTSIIFAQIKTLHSGKYSSLENSYHAPLTWTITGVQVVEEVIPVGREKLGVKEKPRRNRGVLEKRALQSDLYTTVPTK